VSETDHISLYNKTPGGFLQSHVIGSIPHPSSRALMKILFLIISFVFINSAGALPFICGDKPMYEIDYGFSKYSDDKSFINRVVLSVSEKVMKWKEIELKGQTILTYIPNSDQKNIVILSTIKYLDKTEENNFEFNTGGKDASEASLTIHGKKMSCYPVHGGKFNVSNDWVESNFKYAGVEKIDNGYSVKLG